MPGVSSVAICRAAAEEHEHPIPEKLGAVKFPISCGGGNVQAEFERGIALLHSFAYSAAEKAFRHVFAAEPNCGMAHWGVAMTYFRQLWEPYVSSPDVVHGQRETNQAKGMTGSGREREFIDALNIIYANVDSVPYANRAHDYTAAMAHLAERNRNDLECQVFYALALIATASPTDKTHANEKKAADLLEPLFRQHPERKLMSSAAAEEDAVEKHPVTPGAIVPAHEQFGDLLLESNHAPEAAAEVERALSMAPQRRGALLGMSRARELGAAEKRE